jgi:branched-chain amino acid transport system substrate-binding protein
MRGISSEVRSTREAIISRPFSADAPRPARRIAGLVAGLAMLATAQASAEVTIASIAPWSTYRPYAALGSLRGTELKLEAVNEAGGLLGQKLRNIQIDDGCNAEQAEAAVKLAIAGRPVLAMGGACSPAAIDIAKSLATAGILQIVPNAPSQKMTEAGIATILRMTARGDSEGAFAASFIARRWPQRRIAVADDGEANWHESVEALAAGLAQRKIPTVLALRFDPNKPSYAELVRELRDKRIELLYLSGLPPDMGVIVREIGAAGLPMQIVTNRNGKVDAFRQTAGAAAEGIFVSERRDWLDTALADPVLAAEKRSGGDINVFVGGAYAAMTVWAEGVQAAGSFDAAAVAAAVKSRRFSTILGDIAFDAKGDLTPESQQWIWYRWHEGKMEPVP